MYVLPLDTAEADLETVGGKGLSLARMAAAGIDQWPFSHWFQIEAHAGDL